MNDFKEFRTDNFANGKISNEVLDAANPGVLAILSCCYYYESVLLKTTAEGHPWVYTNSNQWAPQKGPFDCILYSGKHGVNCAMPANWVMMDMGVMSSDMRFWGNREGGFQNLDIVGGCIGQCFDIIDRTESPAVFSELFENGEVKPGDIFLTFGHTFIYLGDKLFFAAGHDGKWHEVENPPTEDPRKANFDSWINEYENCGNRKCRITWQIRAKDGFIPRFYRNAAGKLVFNPMLK